jgi:cytochrome c biogenesis protein CcdA
MSMATVTRVNYPRVGLVMITSLIIASAWLVFPYLIQGRQLLADVGDTARMTKGGQVSMYLTRYLVDHPELELTATFATVEFFQYVDRASTISDLRPDRNFVFFVSENIHEGQLTFDLPEVELHLGDNVYLPDRSIGPNVAEHHRITAYSIPRRDADGSVIDISQYDSVRLFVSNHYMGSEDKLTFIGRWNAPYELPETLTSGADITPIAMLALGAGLLSSVLTPCLLQLVVIFGSIIGSFSTVPGEAGYGTSQLTPHIRRKVMQIALAFVIGFTLLYTLAGAVIGHIGHAAQLTFAEYSRPVAIISGVIVILMGIWIGIRGGRNVACRIPDRQAMQSTDRKDAAGSLLVSMGYALGCTACFGGAISVALLSVLV